MKNLSKNISVYLFSIILLTQSVSADDQIIPDTVDVTQEQGATDQNQEPVETLKWSFNPQNEEEREANVKLLKQTAINGSIATAAVFVLLGVIYKSQTAISRLYAPNTYYSYGSYNPKYKPATAGNYIKLLITNHPNNRSSENIAEFLNKAVLEESDIEQSIKNIFEISGVRNAEKAYDELAIILGKIAVAESKLAENEKDYFASSVIDSFKLAWERISLAQETNREYRILREYLKVVFTNTDETALPQLFRELIEFLEFKEMVNAPTNQTP